MFRKFNPARIFNSQGQGLLTDADSSGMDPSASPAHARDVGVWPGLRRPPPSRETLAIPGRTPFLQRQALTTQPRHSASPESAADLLHEQDPQERLAIDARYPVAPLSGDLPIYEVHASKARSLSDIRSIIGARGNEKGEGGTGIFGLAPEHRQWPLRDLILRVDFRNFDPRECAELASCLTELVMAMDPAPEALAAVAQHAPAIAAYAPDAFKMIWSPVHRLPPSCRAHALVVVVHGVFIFSQPELETRYQEHLTAWHELADSNPDEVRPHLAGIRQRQVAMSMPLDSKLTDARPYSLHFRQETNRRVEELTQKVGSAP